MDGTWRGHRYEDIHDGTAGFDESLMCEFLRERSADYGEFCRSHDAARFWELAPGEAIVRDCADDCFKRVATACGEVLYLSQEGYLVERHEGPAGTVWFDWGEARHG